MGRYILCPYFVNEKKGRATISCEDCIRHFGSVPGKEEHIKAYCEADWKGCSFAAALNRTYERMENMQDEKSKKIELLGAQIKASKENNQKLLAAIGKEKKRREKAESEVSRMNRIAEANNKLYRQEIEGMRGKLDLESKRRSWAEAALAACLIELNDGKTEFEIDTEKIGMAMAAYRLEITMTEDGKALAKVIANA